MPDHTPQQRWDYATSEYQRLCDGNSNLAVESERRKRLLLYLSLAVIAYYVTDAKIQKIAPDGANWSVEVKRLPIVVPILLSFQYVYYRIAKLNWRANKLKQSSLNRYFQEMLGLNLDAIIETPQYSLRRRCLGRKFRPDDRGFALANGFAGLSVWLPFAVALAISILAAFNAVSTVTSSLQRAIAYTLIVGSLFCAAAFGLCAQLAFRISGTQPSSAQPSKSSTTSASR